ncbi:MAG: hypothetical protein KC503_10950, partial [Myxococcales bacterium]|nr:hypothetical protein [Myxococcales bacterium]
SGGGSGGGGGNSSAGVGAGSGSGSGDGDGGDVSGGTVRKGSSADRHFIPSVGLGIWARVFRFNDHAPGQDRGEYSSGAVFALALAARVYPLSFFVDKGFLTNIWMRINFKIALGLSSRIGQTGNEDLSTSLWQVIFDLGYRWQFTDKPSSPSLDIGFGFGAHSFGIDWGPAQPQLTNVSYTFMTLGAGFSWPIVKALASPKTANGALGGLGVDLRFAYRIVFSAGDIEDPDQWYGPASVGGIDFGLGAVWQRKSLAIRLGYTLTYYFFAFSDTSAQRVQAGKLTAGGATDTSHTVLVGGAYSF